ncbi:MAG: hypothetical protein H6658_19010, partial [Ardenticatenaceae bacterium]|nr:hypothetical protein [Ardenticatenaceae bacterium]
MRPHHPFSLIHLFKSANRHPLLIVFLLVTALIIWLDILFTGQWFQTEIALINPPIMVFAPQIWLALF